MASLNKPFIAGGKNIEAFPPPKPKRLKAIEEKNARLKRLLAEKELEIQALTEILKNSLIRRN